MYLRRNRKRSTTAKSFAYAAFYFLLVVLFLIFFAAAENLFDAYTITYVLTAVISLIFPAFSFAFLFFRGYNTKEVIRTLGLDKRAISLSMIGFGVLLFVVLFAMEVLVSLLSQASGTQINTNVNILLQSAPTWFFVFTAIIAPIDEEIFFRGFLIPRLTSFIRSTNISIFLSAIFFGALHAGYNSTFNIEIIAAFIFGILAGYVFTRLRSLYPSIIAHMILNSFAILITFVIL